MLEHYWFPEEAQDLREAKKNLMLIQSMSMVSFLE
jgi:hypothetical protein